MSASGSARAKASRNQGMNWRRRCFVFCNPARLRASCRMPLPPRICNTPATPGAADSRHHVFDFRKALIVEPGAHLRVSRQELIDPALEEDGEIGVRALVLVGA